MRQKFDIKYRPQIESGEYEVETAQGSFAKIISWDADEDKPIIALITNKANGYKYAEAYDIKGVHSEDEDSPHNLFVITPETELTEFEKQVAFLKPEYSDEQVKDYAKELLDLAKKQFDSHYDQELKEAYKEADRVQYNRGYADGKADVLKDIPKWHKTEEYLSFLINSRGMLAFVGEDRSTPVVCHNNHYLTLRELLKLPKEE